MKGCSAQISQVADKYREEFRVLDQSLLELGAESDALGSEMVLLKTIGPTGSIRLIKREAVPPLPPPSFTEPALQGK